MEVQTPDQRDAFFDTDELSSDLKRRTVRGGTIAISAQVAKFVMQLGSNALLARILTPGDFGLIAMVTALTGLLEMFKDAGLSMATIQRVNITHAQVSILFWINVALSVVLMSVVAAFAPAIAWLYSEPRLTDIALVLAASMVFGGFTVQHQALLRRKMQFGRLAIIEISSIVAGIIVAIVMAQNNRGYWSLVGMSVTTGGMTAVLSVILSGWVPSLPRRGTGVGPMISFGSQLTGFTFLNYFTRNLDNILIGAVLGARQLGIYSKAYGLLMLPIRQINAPISSVAISALSRLQGDPIRYRRTLCGLTELIALLGMPVVAFAFVDADVLILALLGAQWSDAVSPFRWLAPAAFVGTLNVVPGWVCCTLGRANRQLHWAAISAPLCATAFVVGLRWGINGVAASFSVTWAILLVFFIAYSVHGTSVRLVDVVDAIARPAIASIAGGAAVIVFRNFSAFKPLLFQISMDFAVFFVAFIVMFSVLPEGRSRLHGVLNLRKTLMPKI